MAIQLLTIYLQLMKVTKHTVPDLEANWLLVVLGVSVAVVMEQVTWRGDLATVTKTVRRVAVQRREMIPVRVQWGQRERRPEAVEAVDAVERGSKG